MLIVCPSCASEYELDPETIGPAGRKVRCASCRTSWLVPAVSDEAPAPEAVPAIELPATADIQVESPTPDAAEAVPILDPPAADIPEPEPESEPAVAAEPAAAEPATGEPAVPAAAASAEEALVEPAPPESVEAADIPPTIESRDHAVAPARPRKGARGRKKGGAKARKGGGKAASRRWIGPALGAAGLALVGGLAFGRTAIVAGVPQLAVLYERVGLPVNLVGLDFLDVSSTMTEGSGAASVLVVEGRIRNATRREVEVPEIDIAVRGDSGELLYNWSVKAKTIRLDAGEITTFRALLASPPPAGQRVQVTFKSRGRDVKVALN